MGRGRRGEGKQLKKPKTTADIDLEQDQGYLLYRLCGGPISIRPFDSTIKQNNPSESN